VAKARRPAGDRERDAQQDLAMLAHELRRRVAALSVVGEAIGRQRDQGNDVERMLGLLLGEIDELGRLADEVLRASRPGTQEADGAAAVRAAARTVATARGITVEVTAPEAAVPVRASATMLRQTVENLLDNAARYADAGPVEVDVRPDPRRGHVDIVVADRGPGPVGPRAGRRPGHGIGLFLVRRFLDEVGGRSWVSERPGGGTLVGIRLPLRQPELGAAAR
jgi:signal transduction histidine kinase